MDGVPKSECLFRCRRKLQILFSHTRSRFVYVIKENDREQRTLNNFFINSPPSKNPVRMPEHLHRIFYVFHFDGVIKLLQLLYCLPPSSPVRTGSHRSPRSLRRSFPDEAFFQYFVLFLAPFQFLFLHQWHPGSKLLLSYTVTSKPHSFFLYRPPALCCVSDRHRLHPFPHCDRISRNFRIDKNCQ